MVNRMMDVVGSLYFVSQAEQVNKPHQVEKNFNECLTERVEKIQRITRLNELNQQEKKATGVNYFKTEVVTDEGSAKPVVITTNRHSYRQINLSGEAQETDYTLLNPLKIKAAYFNDEV